MDRNKLYYIALAIIPLLFSMIVHEVAHGLMAYKLGDTTAKDAGRLTLNPLPHLDPMMSVVVPLLTYLLAGVFFGGAKPVPFNPYNFYPHINMRKGTMCRGCRTSQQHRSGNYQRISAGHYGSFFPEPDTFGFLEDLPCIQRASCGFQHGSDPASRRQQGPDGVSAA